MIEDAVVTEAGSDPSAGYESRETLELVELMNAADATVTDAVAAVSSQIAAAIDAIADRMLAGGRLVYVGAGSSGRIAALDASECEATFSTAPGASSPSSRAARLRHRSTRPPPKTTALAGRRDLVAPSSAPSTPSSASARAAHAVRARCARSCRACRRAHRMRRLCARLRARRARRPRDRRHRRPRVPRRLDAAQGRTRRRSSSSTRSRPSR